MSWRSISDFFPTHFRKQVSIINLRLNELPQHSVLLLRHSLRSCHSGQQASDLHNVAEMICGYLQLFSFIFHFIWLLNDNAISMLQQEIQIVQRWRIFIFKSIQQSFLNHSELHRWVVQCLSELLQLLTAFEMHVNRCIKLFQGQTLLISDFVVLLL